MLPSRDTNASTWPRSLGHTDPGRVSLQRGGADAPTSIGRPALDLLRVHESLEGLGEAGADAIAQLGVVPRSVASKGQRTRQRTRRTSMSTSFIVCCRLREHVSPDRIQSPSAMSQRLDSGTPSGTIGVAPAVRRAGSRGRGKRHSTCAMSASPDLITYSPMPTMSSTRSMKSEISVAPQIFPAVAHT